MSVNPNKQTLNQYKHDQVKVFDTEELMRERCQKCHDIALTNRFEPFVLYDATKSRPP